MGGSGVVAVPHERLAYSPRLRRLHAELDTGCPVADIMWIRGQVFACFFTFARRPHSMYR